MWPNQETCYDHCGKSAKMSLPRGAYNGLNRIPQKGYAEVITLSTSKYDLIWNQGPCRCNSLRQAHIGAGRPLIQYDWCPLKDRSGDTGTQAHEGERHVTMEAKTEILQLQAKECRGLPATTRHQERARKDSPLKVPEGAWSCQHFDFRPPDSKTVR